MLDKQQDKADFAVERQKQQWQELAQEQQKAYREAIKAQRESQAELQASKDMEAAWR